MTLRAWQKPNKERDQKVGELAQEGLSAQAIAKELKHLGYGTISRQRVRIIQLRNKKNG